MKKSSRPRCPHCGYSLDADCETFPFCCSRCRDVDLGKWLLEKYVISRPVDLEDGDLALSRQPQEDPED